MPDIGLNPPKRGNVHSRTGTMADALAKFGSVLVASGTTDHSLMATTTSAGANGVMGVVRSQGDPNNSNLFPVGAEADVQDMGDCQILVLGGTTYTRLDYLITSTTAGVCKKLAAETGAQIVAQVLQDVTTGALPQLISGRLMLVSRGS